LPISFINASLSVGIGVNPAFLASSTSEAKEKLLKAIIVINVSLFIYFNPFLIIYQNLEV
jgi:hypothetical protein